MQLIFDFAKGQANRDRWRDVIDCELKTTETLHILNPCNVPAVFTEEIQPAKNGEIACIDVEYISWVRYHYGISVYCYRYPLKPVQPFCHVGRALTIVRGRVSQCFFQS